jgi:hypothetical protein
MKTVASLLAAAVLALTSHAFAATYYVDPAKGAAANDGSQEKPWKTLEEVVKDGKLKTLKGGDTLLCADGMHGNVNIAGENDSTITIAAAPGARPHLSKLNVNGKNWDIKGFVVSSSFDKQAYRDNKGYMITFGESADSSKITIEDCYVFTEEDSSNWDVKAWMSASNGILMGRRGKDLTLRNNYVSNTRFGIALTAFDSLAEGNVVTDFSGDGMRATRDGETVQYNIIKNVYVSAKDGDDNHDDAIQCFLFNKGTGTIKNMTFIGNIIKDHENPNQKWKNNLQGLGFFDGPLVDFVVKDNVVYTDHYHGISLYDAQNADVENNVVMGPPGGKKLAIRFDSKKKVNAARDNKAKNNYASSFSLKTPGTIDENNKPVTEAIYKDALKKAYKTICDKFGAHHFAANKDKLEIK